MENIPNIDNDHHIVSNLFLMLLGEQCDYTYKSTDGIFHLQQEADRLLPRMLLYKMDGLAILTTRIRYIERWRNNSSNCVDHIKRALFEQISAVYKREFSDIVVRMRDEHLEGFKGYSIYQILSFVSTWQDRIGYLTTLITHITSTQSFADDWVRAIKKEHVILNEMNGMEAMNMVFDELTLQCKDEWSYRFLESILMASSAALHRVVCTWLLEGELYKNVPWMIGPDEIDKNESVMSIRSHVHFGSDSFLAKVKIVKELVPRSLQSSPSLINEILEIGRKVKFLKEIRRQLDCDDNLSVISRMIETGLKPEKIWYDVRERGCLSLLLPRINKIVSNETMKELMLNQRIMDHLNLLHHYFFMLRSDLIVGITDSIITYSGANSRKAMAEKHLNDALCNLIPPKRISDLIENIKATRSAPSPSKTSFEDLLQPNYKPPEPVHSILCSSIDIYRRIFSLVCPLLLLLFNLDRLTSRLRYNNAKMDRASGVRSPLRRIHLKLQKIRQFLTRLLSHIFDNILDPESKKICANLSMKSDLHQFISTHGNMLTKYVAGKLFCRKSTAHQREQLALCTNTIRSVIKTVSVFVESVENATDDELRLELVSENGPLERTLSEFSELEPKLAVLEEFKIST